MSYLNELNDVQKEAVICTDGPVMVIAGAGSGKTRVLTYRIAHLLQHGVDAFQILALTFTNKAAKEMKERISEIAGTDAKNLWMGTFHSVFARILRFEADKLSYPSNFTIYDTDDSKSLIKTILKEMGLDDKIYKPNLVYNRISSAKNNLISPQAYLQNVEVQADDRATGKPKIGEIYVNYQKRCFKSGAMDFDDILFNTNILLRDHPEVLIKYQMKFKYILVDEYQDTNYSQYVIVKKLAARNENICVVGDDAQSIYSFRGANIQNILNFQKDYPDVKTFKLEQNYRSTQTIVNAANSIIWKNKDQIKKEVWTDNPTGEKIKVLKALTDNEEGYNVANSIFDINMGSQTNPKDFAILYRTNAQSRSMEEALRKKNIPYRIYGGLSFYKRKEIKDMLAYFRLTINNNDEEALKRIINYPVRGIGQTTLDKIILAAGEEGKTLWNTLKNINTQAGLNAGAKGKIMEFVTMISSFTVHLETENAYDLANRIASSSGLLKELYTDKTPEGVSRYENIQELLNGIKEFTDKIPEGEKGFLSDFMQDIALLTDSDEDDKNDNNKVSLMTIHAAKGLEFPYVFIVGLEENLFPSQMSLYSREELEEERRLFYVALTRARKKAFLTYAATRYRWGNLISCEPSRFIEEIDAQYLDKPTVQTREEAPQKNFDDEFDSWHGKPVYGKQAASTFKKPEVKTYSSPSAPKRNLVKLNEKSSMPASNNEPLPMLEVGMEVEHLRFGTGKIVNLEGKYPEQKATIDFGSAGPKQLLLKFAKLKVLNN